ncbi:hypothetical protein PanWU01x14_260580, partial [Parasponia andersonii]
TISRNSQTGNQLVLLVIALNRKVTFINTISHLLGHFLGLNPGTLLLILTITRSSLSVLAISFQLLFPIQIALNLTIFNIPLRPTRLIIISFVLRHYFWSDNFINLTILPIT